MINISTTTSSKHKDINSQVNDDSPKHSRRNTVHNVSLNKKERRHQRHRTVSPTLSNEDSSGSQKSKKQKKILRGKDRDDKLLQPEPLPAVGSKHSGLSRAASIGGSEVEYRTPAVMTSDYLMPQRSVTESLNPYHQRKGEELREQGRIRRTNSDAQYILGSLNGVKERRCPPDRKQFYRQFIKSIKFYGINSTAANRMETPAPSHVPRFHSENLASSNPYSPIMDKLWLEIQAFLRDRTPEQHEEWLFFYQRVDQVLNKIIYYSCSCPSSTQSVKTLCMPSREGYEALHGSYSSPVLTRRKDSVTRDISAVVARTHFTPTRPPEEQPPMPHQPQLPQGEAPPTASEELTNGEIDSTTEQTHTESCTVEHHSFLSSLQQKALREVDELLQDLDEVELLYMNRRRMGDEHPKYRTTFFKRRVAALILWHKVTHGLAEKLCQLSNWLGVAVLFPDICVDVSTINEVGVVEAEGVELVNPACSVVCPKSPKSPRVTNLIPQFSVGSPDIDVEESLSKIRSGLPQIVTQSSVATLSESSSSQSATALQRLFSQDSRHDSYREFVSRVLKRKGIAFAVSVSCKCVDNVLLRFWGILQKRKPLPSMRSC